MAIDSLKSVIDPPIAQLVGDFTRIWMEAGEDVDLGPAIDDAVHAVRESHLDRFLDQALEEFRHPFTTPEGFSLLEARMLIGLAQLGQDAFDLTPAHLEILLQRGMPQSLVQFARTARTHRSISDAETFQASRNVGVMNTLQLMLGQQCRLTPAVFAYSMLYPYSDNYLDNPRIPAATKREFNGRFGRRLAGEIVAPANRHEKQIFSLVATIESEKDRELMPQVYDSLLAIHRAQSKSLDLEGIKQPVRDDVLAITLEKGGSSVLADAYLIAENRLTPQQVRFIFGLGIFLQLVDDLQDLKPDLKGGNVTLFCLAAKDSRALESLANRAIAFGRKVMDDLDAFSAPGIDPLKQVIRMSVAQLMIGAAYLSREFFGSDHLSRLEAHFSFRFTHLDKVTATLKKQKVSWKNTGLHG
ncbi:hypothetical protein [Dehalogenimonas etheniformans]|uniref:Uncharacterized protein n=1 Tax=Dehalogenimonas etheniformans TaxID=1536648 RepID=A0A2P5P4R7_9CHLR|nr:hypothetical protein [Dehalogenimonas etheniformans]PPD57293.1 hypothetical protein JP09_009600 [Dehalogenimonas etheniformans]QNT77009.1 hypothetical protein HX448_10150 [Dehalogenimonas etheniformans]